MTIVTDIQEYTDYDSTDVTNAVTAATRLCAVHGVDDNTSIEKTAIWLLERLREERKARSDPSINVRNMKDIDDYIKSLIAEDQDENVIVSKYTSPANRNKDNWYNPSSS